MTTNYHRAAVYLRLSEETEATTSPERQRELCEAYARRKGWEVVEEFADIDVSATKSRLERPALSKLRDAIQAGRIDVVIVWRLDRLARSVLDTLVLLNEWEGFQCAVASATEEIDLTTPMGRAMVTLIAVFAEMEATAIRSRVRGSIDKLRRSNRFAGGTVPYGYVPVPLDPGPGRGLAVDQAEAAVVRDAMTRVLSGDSLYRICHDLNEQEVPAPRSEFRRLSREGRAGGDRGTWRTQSLNRLLNGDHLCGFQRHHGDLVRDETTGLPAVVWPPVLQTFELDALKEKLAPREVAPGARKERVVSNSRLLSGLAFCADCGSKLYVWMNNGRDQRRVYGCPNQRNGQRCSSPRIMADRLEEFVEKRALELFGQERETVNVAMELPGQSGPGLAEIERAIRETTEELARDDADAEKLVARLKLLKGSRADARKAKRAAHTLVVQETGRSWAEAWADQQDDGGRRRMLADVLDQVLVKASPPGNHRKPVEWRTDLLWATA